MMKAERELDALIAEKVMGWDISKDDTLGWRTPHPHNKYNMVPIPHFSTRIADAWLVVEKFPKRVVAVARSFFEDGPVFWDCTIGRASAEADTAPLAICLAALKAVGHNDKTN